MKNTLFNETTIKRLVEGTKLTAKQKKASQEWLNLMEEGELMKEKRGYLKFYDIILKGLLGYDNIKHEKEGVEFSYEKDNKSVVRIEAKGMDTKDLFLPQKRAKEESPAEQVWRYMNRFATPYGIVTNYKLFVLFKYDVGNTKYYLFDFDDIRQNPNELKEFVAIFSKESIDGGFIDKLHKESIIEEREFTKEFYKLYHETRLMLVKEFENNTDINKDASVHFAQIFLNRLMFAFFAEDTGKIEKRVIEDRILKTLDNIHLFSSNSNNISSVLVGLFKDLDNGSDFPTKLFGFNGGLFKHPIPDRIHFRDLRESKFFKDIYQNSKLKSKTLKLNEKEREIFEKYKNKLNPTIENILLMASFDFNTEVNVNILGHIFEQSISDIEDLKTDKTSRRKKEGIFYTPEYITEYICRNTIIPYLSEKGATTTYDLIKEYANNIGDLEKKFKEIKILDPACGSGAFLIKATEVMLEIFKAVQEFKQQEGQYEAQRGLKKRSNNKGQLVLTKWNEEEEAREIIGNNIFGVDINEESVEITKLSLFLKMARKNRKLTDLSNNIKQGNSLIDNEEIAGKLAFNWNEKFKEIMDNGGFDVVIGNPPYGAKLEEKEVNFVKKKYSVGNSETAQLMMEKAYSLLKDKGYHGFIIPKAFTFVSTWNKIRNKFFDELNAIIDCKKVWKEVKLEQIIYTIKKGDKFKRYDSGVRDNQSIKIIANVDKSLIPKFDGVLLNSLSNQEIKIGSRLKEIKSTLGTIGVNKWGDVFYKKINHNKKGFKVLGGNEIQRYYRRGIKGYIEEKHAKTDQSLIKPNSVLLQRIIAHIENPADHLKISGTIFENSNYRIVNTVHQLTLGREISNKYVLAIANSNFMNWFVYRFVFAKAIRSFQFSRDVAKKIPIPKISLPEQKPFIEKAELMLKLNKEFYERKNKFLKLMKHEYKLDKLSNKLKKFHELNFDEFVKELKIKLNIDKKAELLDFFEKNKKEIKEISEKIEKTDEEINDMVYDLYGITAKEKEIIEKSL
ncbi:MAG: DNA methyltransferase [archaeon]